MHMAYMMQKMTPKNKSQFFLIDFSCKNLSVKKVSHLLFLKAGNPLWILDFILCGFKAKIHIFSKICVFLHTNGIRSILLYF